jgi:hypothetical protein
MVPPAITGSVLSVFAMRKSATGVTVVLAVLELLALFESVSTDVTVAVLATVVMVASATETMIVAVAVLPEARLPTVKVTVLPTVPTEALLDVAETIFSVAGMLSVMITPLALANRS